MRLRALLLAALLTLAALLGVTPSHAAAAARPDFIDLSSNNAFPDLAAYARAGHTKIALKANEGTGYVWTGGENVADQAHAAGVAVWHYDFARPGPDAAAEARVLIAVARAHWRAGDRLVLDLEVTGNLTDSQLAQWVSTYLATTDAAGLGSTIVYSGSWFLGPRPATLAVVGRGARPFWQAAYTTTRPDAYGLNVVAWQYWDRATGVAGQPGGVDISHDYEPAAVAAPTKPAAAAPAVDGAIGNQPQLPVATLVLGNRGTRVTQLQRALNARHLAKLKVTGVYDQPTRAVIVRIQHGLGGRLTPGVWDIQSAWELVLAKG